jgi:hypothetical protein
MISDYLRLLTRLGCPTLIAVLCDRVGSHRRCHHANSFIEQRYPPITTERNELQEAWC